MRFAGWSTLDGEPDSAIPTCPSTGRFVTFLPYAVLFSPAFPFVETSGRLLRPKSRSPTRTPLMLQSSSSDPDDVAMTVDAPDEDDNDREADEEPPSRRFRPCLRR